MDVDYIIVGLGLAGLAFAEELERNHKSFVVFEDNSQNSSLVAGGVYNPVILKRFTPVHGLILKAETAFEGLRYLDIKRWKIMEERVAYYNANDRVNAKMSIRTFAPKNYVWPIPQFELDINTALVQHELW